MEPTDPSNPKRICDYYGSPGRRATPLWRSPVALGIALVGVGIGMIAIWANINPVEASVVAPSIVDTPLFPVLNILSWPGVFLGFAALVFFPRVDDCPKLLFWACVTLGQLLAYYPVGLAAAWLIRKLR